MSKRRPASGSHWSSFKALDRDRVLALTRVTVVSQRGVPADQPSASLYYFAEAKVRRIEAFLDRAEAFEAAGQSE
ncbi:MAG: hypothetical protein WBZ00_12305 [Solirubrobacterales bacterium]